MHLAHILVLCLLAQNAKASQGDALLSAIEDAFVSNQAAFPFGQVSFTYTRGSARDGDAVRRGELNPAYTAKCFYTYNGVSARYDRIFPDDAMRLANKKIGSDIISIIDTCRMATNGEVTLYDSVTVADSMEARGTRLTPGPRDFDRDFQFPLSLGRPDHGSLDNLGRHLLEAIKGKSGSQTGVKGVDQHVEYEGRRLVKLTLTSATSENEYWIDMERGAVPLKIVSSETAPPQRAGYRTEYHLDDLRLVAGRGWLPFRESWWYSDDSRAYQVVIGEAHFDDPPRVEAFALDFPRAISLVDDSKGVRYPPSRTWNVLRLPGPHAHGVQKVERASIPQSELPRLPGEMPSQGCYDYLLYGAVALVLAVGLILWRRRNARA